MKAAIIQTSKHRYRLISKGILVNRNTPVGEPADFFESKPYGGRKLIEPLVLIRDDCTVDYYRYLKFDYDAKKWIPTDVPPEVEKLVTDFVEKHKQTG